jgi:hypothetical protein
MNLRHFVFPPAVVLCATLLIAQVPQSPSQHAETGRVTLEDLKAHYRIQSVTFREDGTLQGLWGDIQLSNKTGDPEKDALSVIELLADLIQVKDPRTDLVLRKPAHGCAIVFRQQVNGIPVDGATITVSFNTSGNVSQVWCHYYPNLEVSATPVLSSRSALKIVARNLQIAPESADSGSDSELHVFMLRGKPHLSYYFRVMKADDLPYKYEVDAVSGKILSKVKDVIVD